MSAQSPELVSKLAVWRAKAADGTLSKEEMIEAVRELRSGRMAAAQTAASAKSRAKAKAEIKPANDLLDELEGM